MKKFSAWWVMTIASVAFATPPESDFQLQVQRLVQQKLVSKLDKRDSTRGRFSRAFQPPLQRRVRVTDTAVNRDARGGEFVSFFVDARFPVGIALSLEDNEASWKKGAMEGCAYLATGEVFVRARDVYYPAAVMLGRKQAAADAHVCHSGDELAAVR